MTNTVDQGRSILERPLRQMSWPELIAAVVCLAGMTSYLYLVNNLPAGHSRGDVGPAAMPYGVAVSGVLLSLVLLVMAFRIPASHDKPSFPAFARVIIFIGAFFVVPIVANFIGLAVALGIAAGFVTLLFSGKNKLIAALGTALGTWVIAEFMFTRFLGLPLP